MGERIGSNGNSGKGCIVKYVHPTNLGGLAQRFNRRARKRQVRGSRAALSTPPVARNWAHFKLPSQHRSGAVRVDTRVKPCAAQVKSCFAAGVRYSTAEAEPTRTTPIASTAKTVLMARLSLRLQFSDKPAD
jgi:hypothetical protein